MSLDERMGEDMERVNIQDTDAQKASNLPLKGVTVIELAGLAPGPLCGMMLADFGARVIRIDRPGAPDIDKLGRGKESVSIDLKTKEGVAVLKRLSLKADVLLEPFRPGVMEKLGLGPDDLTEANPKLVYARLTGYGQTGQMSQAPGHDINFMAISGLLPYFGRKNEKPLPPLNFLADFACGGMLCAFAILVALFERTKSGKGQVIDASMVEGVAYIGSWVNGVKDLYFPKPRGENLLDGGFSYYNTYETKDGKYMAVGAYEPQFYKQLIKGLGLEGKNVTQAGESAETHKLFTQVFLTKTRDEWTDIFMELEACVSPVLDFEEAAQFSHNKEKGTFGGRINGFLQANPAPRLSRTGACREQRTLPRLGEHSLDVLSSFDFKSDEISSLIRTGVVKLESKKS